MRGGLRLFCRCGRGRCSGGEESGLSFLEGLAAEELVGVAVAAGLNLADGDAGLKGEPGHGRWGLNGVPGTASGL